MEQTQEVSPIRRIGIDDFIRLVRRYTRPGRPAFSALARELGIELIADRTCKLETCGKKFLPSREWQEFCSTTCSSAARQRRFVKARKGSKKGD